MALTSAERQARYRARHKEQVLERGRAFSKKWHAAHRDEALATMRARYLKHREERRAQVKAKRLLLNKDEESARRKALWAANKARWNASRRLRRAVDPEARRKQAEWRAAHRDRINEQNTRRRARPEERAKAVARTARWNRLHPEHARALHRIEDSKRRAREREVFVEVVVPMVVYQRDKGICGICRKSVDIASRWEIDHIVPIAKRGPHSYANVQLAHMTCNRRKGNRESVSVSRHVHPGG
jgi:5-methylcytosine-specific restriction endonuclease McrA